MFCVVIYQDRPSIFFYTYSLLWKKLLDFSLFLRQMGNDCETYDTWFFLYGDFFGHVKHSFLQNPNTLVQHYETNQGLNNHFGSSISFRVNLNSLKRDLTKLIFFTSDWTEHGKTWKTHKISKLKFFEYCEFFLFSIWLHVG